MNKVEELSIEVTNECTLACIHCSSGSVPKRVPNELPYTTHVRLLREARAIGANTLSLSGGNPLLYDRLVDLVNRASTDGYSRILIYTTGHSHAGQTIDQYPAIHDLLENPLITWVFSLHSHNVEVNNMIMNTKWAAEDIMYSLDWLRTHGGTTEVHMVPMKPNYTHIPQVRDLCATVGVKKLSLLRFVPQTRGKANVDALGMDKQDFVRMQMIIADEFSKDHPVALRAGCPIDFRHAIGALPQKAKPCHAGDDLILVRPNGTVHPCAAWKSLPSDSNVREANLADIWRDSRTFAAIRKFKESGYNMVSGCTGCSFLDSCKTGCPAQRLHAYGKKSMDDLYIGCSDPLCPKGNNGTKHE